jgi:hypothetical protein
MIQLTAAQVEWLCKNQPLTKHICKDKDGYLSDWVYIDDSDVFCIKAAELEYYLTPDTYNLLPQTFKDLK